MSELSSNQLEKYIQKILAIETAIEETPLDLSERKQIALDLGMTENEWGEILQTEKDHRTRGVGHLRHENWDDAIAEFKEAIVLNPNHAPLNMQLASAFMKRWQDTEGDREDIVSATKYAKKCLSIDPENDRALALLKAVQGEKSKPAGGTSKPNMMVMIARGLLVLIIGLGIFKMMPSDDPVIENPPEQLLNNQNQVPEAPPLPVEEGVLFSDFLDIPVRFMPNDKSKGLTPTIESSDFKQYNNAWSYTMQIDFAIEGREIDATTIEVILLDSSMSVISKERKEILRDYQHPLRPGDILPADYLQHVSTDEIPNIAEVQLRVVQIQTLPAATQYPESPLLEKDWPNKPPAFELDIRERLIVVQQGYMMDDNKLSHEINFEVKNVGASAIRRLALMVHYYNKEGDEVAEKRIIAGLRSQPSLKPGQTRIARSTIGLPDMTKDSFGDYTIEVLYAE